MTTTKIIRDELRSFVAGIQKAVLGDRSTSAIKARLADIEKSVFGGKHESEVELTARSYDSDVGTLRVLEPTGSVATASVRGGVPPNAIDFYLTRPVGADVAETRLLGTAKYPDSNGRWTVRFLTDRFALRPDETVALHAEVMGEDGRLLSVSVINMPC